MLKRRRFGSRRGRPLVWTWTRGSNRWVRPFSTPVVIMMNVVTIVVSWASRITRMEPWLWLCSLVTVFVVVTLAFAVTSGWLVIAVPVIILIMRMALRPMMIMRVAILITITRGLVLRTIGWQAWGLTIVRMSKIMTRTGVPCYIVTICFAIATEVFCATTLGRLFIVGPQRVVSTSSGMFLVSSIPLLVRFLAFFLCQSLIDLVCREADLWNERPARRRLLH